jgi:hypothetical protein
MEKLYRYIKKKINEDDIQYIENTKYYHNINLSFLSKKMTHKIKSTNYNLYKYTRKLKNININLLVYDPIKNSYNQYLIENIILRIKKMVGLCKNNTLQQLDITIFLLNEKKKITENTSIIGINEVNSGCSIINNIHNKIYIWRDEEVYKVLIHELIHSLDLDPISSNNSFNKLFLSKFSYCSKEVNLFEAYVEFWATIINILFIMSYAEGGTASVKELENYIENEIVFAYKQTSKILRYNGINNFKDFYFYKEDLFNDNEMCNFKEESNVFMYYFGKLLLLINYDYVFKLCEHACNGYIINIKKSLHFTDKLIEIMMDSLDENTINNFNYFLKLKYNNTSLKMTYYG